MTDTIETTLPPTTAGDLQSSAKLDERDLVAPPASDNLGTPAIKLSPLIRGMYESMRRMGVPVSDSYLQSGAVGAVTGNKSIADKHAARCTPSVVTPPPTPPIPSLATGELYTKVKEIVAGQTHLPDDVSALVAFWVISTWFQDVLNLAPCLVITGPPHEANLVLATLYSLCRRSERMADVSGTVLKKRSGSSRTMLLWSPSLGKRTAELIGCFTNPGFTVEEGGYYPDCYGSRAVYAGEAHPLQSILHSIHITAAATANTLTRNIRPLSEGTTKEIQRQLEQYREQSLAKVHKLEFNAPGLSSEIHAIANTLGSCIVDAPELQAELVGLLMPLAQQQIADRADSLQALVVGAALTLCHQGKDQIFVKEIATEVNRLQEARGETLKVSPEKVGHKLKQAGVLTRRLSQAGNGLIMNRATMVLLHEVAATYHQVGEDSPQLNTNLHCPLCEQNKGVVEVM